MNHARILLVEDEPNLRRTLTDLLRSDGYVVESSDDGVKGQELATKNPFDLIILDVMLPSRDGFEVCRRLRENGINTPVLMLTARSELNNKVQGFKAGSDDYLTKPFETPELEARIEALLRRASRGRAQLRVRFRWHPRRLHKIRTYQERKIDCTRGTRSALAAVSDRTKGNHIVAR